MANVSSDTQIIVPKDLRNRIKSRAAALGISMREYLNRLLDKEE
jgi:predicted DNA binding CopG/RHH family protein